MLCRSEENLKSPGHSGRAGSSLAPGTTAQRHLETKIRALKSDGRCKGRALDLLEGTTIDSARGR